MDLSESRTNKRHSGKKLPRVPIKTYKWEDVRRSRRRGGYPWTHLYKNSFDELTDPKNFTMDGLKKNKSSASSASDSLDIKEITEDDVKGLEDIDSSYVVIESPILLGGQIEESPNDQEMTIESAESSDNISQYLDKEERGPEQQLESTETLTLPGPSTPKILVPQELPKERAKSEEPERKRKLSIDSNYSRISLSRLGLMKRLKEAKGKIKLPKLGGSPKSENKVKPKTEEPKPTVQKELSTKPHKAVNPVYIHIPLKPPEGQTDEFSYLEFEEKRPKLPSPPEIHIEVSEDKENDGNTSNIAESDHKDERDQVESSDNMLKIGSPDDQDDDVSAIIFLEGDEENENKGEYDIMVVDIDEKSQEMTMSQVTNTEVRRQVLDSIKRVESQAELSKSQDKKGSGGNLSRSSSKGSKTSKSSIRKRRAKSAEPEKKRRSSIDSSYSRKSLSKIGLLKKLKQFHLPFKKSQSKKSIKSVTSTEKAVVPAAQSHDIFKPHAKDQKPVYIHIPLKPPTGEQDEFSHLEFETAPPPKQKIEKSESNEAKEEEKSPIESPQSVQSPQFIFLTPPSDDELLEKPDIPETPSSETGSLFQFGELKILAKKAVEQVHGNLDSVDEEAEPKMEGTNVVTEAIVEHQPEKQEEEAIEGEDVTVDEEDGLKCALRSTDDAKSALKSNLKGDGSPVPKKKVSFKKRKPSQVSTDDGYEEIQSPSETPQLESTVVQNVTDVAKNEEPSNSDKSVKSNLVEEVVNRWSKISDHEYEPINPPSDEHKEVSPPKFHVSEVLNSSSGTPHQHPEDEHLDFTIQEMQTEIETRFFRNDNAAAVDSATDNLDTSKRSSRSRSKEKEPAKPNKFQIALKESATKFKTKLQAIKKPNISLPARPKFHKPNIKKPNIKKPNITMPNINLPKLSDLSNTFRRTERSEEKKSEVEAVTSESPEKNAQGIFSFSTYPRLFKKKKRDYDSGSLKGKAGSLERKKKEVKVKVVKTQSTPQTAGNNSADSIRIPLHSRESMDQENGLFPLAANMEEDYTVEEEKESPRRYQEDIDTDDEQDAIQRERQEKHRAAVEVASQPEESRWKHGNFFQNGTDHHYDDEEPADEEVDEENPEDYEADYEHQEIVTDLDQPEETHQPSIPTRHKLKLQQHDSIDTNHSRDVGSSVSSLGQHRRGVIEEIDSDQFFLREKGISQDNIDMGRYLSTEIREAFRVPTNALADMHAYNYTEMRDSNQSLPETKRKPIKKPKRRKTPHTSQERLRYEPESENEDYNFMPPTRPKRRSKKRSRPEDDTEDVIPYIETISVDNDKVEDRDKFSRFYDNNELEGVEYRDKGMSQPYKNMLYVQESIQRRASEPIPAAPPRKHKSLKSLNASEHESIFNDYENDHENKKINADSELPKETVEIVPTNPICRNRIGSLYPSATDPPFFEEKGNFSRRDVKSRNVDKHLDTKTIILHADNYLLGINGYGNQDAFMSSQRDDTSITAKHDDNIQGPNRPPKPPSRSRSKTKSMSRGTSQADSMFDRTDSIMYDEELREPVVEEPFVQDLRDAMGYAIVDKSQLKNWEHKCCTVPRSHGKDKDGAPERPLRNYSTLGPSRPPRKLSRNMTDEEKENIDITQYIEIDDDRDLQSGEVIQKMQNRPLPAPPRPPRLKTKPFSDITSEENVMVGDDVQKEEITEEEVEGKLIDETEVSTQTEPLPADFVCEEVVQEETDKIMTPSVLRKNGSPNIETEVTYPTEKEAGVTKTDVIKVETKLITPTRYTYEEETITHGQLLVEPLNGAQILPNSELSRERIIPITSDEEDTSEIPESFDRLLDPDEAPPTTQQEPQKPLKVQTTHATEEDVPKTQKLKISDLDVDRLTVNELVANKIIVSEIDSGNITAHDINSKSGSLKLTDIELEPSIVKKLLEQLQESSKKQQSILEEDTASVNLEDSQVEEKKTSIDFRVLETSTSQDSTTTVVPSMRQSSTTSEIHENTTETIKEPQEEKVDSEPALIKEELVPENSEVPESEIKGELSVCDEKCAEPLIDEGFEQKLDFLSETPTVLGSEGEEPPVRPPRSFEKKNSLNEVRVSEEDQREFNSEFGQSEDDTGQEDAHEFAENTSGFRYSEMFEPEIDDEPPPRPPQPQVPYVPSQPPPSFYALRAHHYVENISEDIPLVPRRKRHHRVATISRSSSSEAEGVPAPRRRVRTPEPSISQLSLQLVCACGTSARNMIKRLIEQLNGKFADSSNAGSDSSRHNVQVIIVILLVLIAGLLLLGYGDGRTVHLHHWEYFNPPKDI